MTPHPTSRQERSPVRASATNVTRLTVEPTGANVLTPDWTRHSAHSNIQGRGEGHGDEDSAEGGRATGFYARV